jgi:hypothetical protein
VEVIQLLLATAAAMVKMAATAISKVLILFAAMAADLHKVKQAAREITDAVEDITATAAAEAAIQLIGLAAAAEAATQDVAAT